MLCVALLGFAGSARAQDPPAAPVAAADSQAVAGPAAADSQAVSPAAPAPGPNAAPTVVHKVRLDKSVRNVVRSGPGDGFAIVGVFPRGSVFEVLSKRGDWFDVRVSETETGWIHASLCHEFEDLSDLEWKPNPKRYTRTGAIVVSGYGGAYAFDRKSNSFVAGTGLGYYVFDRVQVGAGLSFTHVHRPAEIVESLFGVSLEAEDFDMLFYRLDATYEVLPGRQMVPYVSVGAGASMMQGDTETSLDYGAGTTLFLSKRTAMRWEFRGYRFRTGSDAARAVSNNVEFTLGTLYVF